MNPELVGAYDRLARVLPGYRKRPQQISVSEAMLEAMSTGQHCICEAGTGTGKSLAYLIAAAIQIEQGKTVVVSTHTTGLQGQLFTKDIPALKQVFPEVFIRPIVMKGRGQYLCKRNFDAHAGTLLAGMDDKFDLVDAWTRDTQTGDAAELPFGYAGWGDINCTSETCNGKECHYYPSCWYYRMKNGAKMANLIVVNHALLLSNLLLPGEASILPEYDFVVIDEAHHLEDVATGVFGIQVEQTRIERMLHRLQSIPKAEWDKDRQKIILALNTSLFAHFMPKQSEDDPRRSVDFNEAIRFSESDDVSDRMTLLTIQLEALAAELHSAVVDERYKPLVEGAEKQIERTLDEFAALFAVPSEDTVRWAEIAGSEKRPTVVLRMSPLHVGEMLKELLWDTTPCTLTSATLSTLGAFDFLKSRLSLDGPTTEKIVGSPFDFRRQAVTYIPKDLPNPGYPDQRVYQKRMMDELLRVVGITTGRALVLCTSRRSMQDIARALRLLGRYEVLMQGDAPPMELIHRFRSGKNTVLVGTSTFWEGIDVQGDALSCVVIDRLPFSVPDDPIIKARTDQISRSGGNWFMDYSLPSAMIRLKQGFGRLIRTSTDRGIVCILDTRLLTKRYGGDVLRGLPPAPVVRTFHETEQHWRTMSSEPALL